VAGAGMRSGQWGDRRCAVFMGAARLGSTASFQVHQGDDRAAMSVENDSRDDSRTMQIAAVVIAGVEGVGVHTLRHSAAVGWLEAGVHIKAVADLLGHSSIAITGDVYGHTTDSAARGAVDGWSSALGL
jgi:integrase